MSKNECITLERPIEIDGYIRVKYPEALQSFEENEIVFLTVNDSSPDSPHGRKIQTSKDLEFDSFSVIYEIFKKKSVRFGEWVTLWVSV